ncbi:uncharacterized protein Z518_01120 [Rhinocladiella mackenziei CBS 650.93]|uniref:SNF2 family helicase/ATPase n=1 Tax=Rhinocladiella mackenziei CBS 650.93 TaxID=1442369 RepID=A0A0D2IVI4_9EURO|nr:uncharacterized protein Z518_01120 [Rhinocladiella mackenziei CBS 650.93]KIX10039.1 hypothetical protein Z518_01120 [Rhinocladiella mackenziei CBS 650.93]
METSIEADNDPRGWSIDQVIQELCHNSPPSWPPPNWPQQIPDRHLLEDNFRRNHVDGDNLLALDMATLKDDLGIISFGQRRAIMKTIEYLRHHSRSYQQMAFQADSIGRMQSATYATPRITHSRMSLVPQPPAVAELGIHPSVESRQPTLSPSLNGIGRPRFAPTDPQGFAQLDSATKSTGNFMELPRPETTQATPTRTREPKSASDVSGTSGRPSPATNNVSSLAPHGETPSKLPERRRKDQTIKSGQKRIAPTFVSPLPEATPAESSGSYLSQSAVPLQDIFYYKISSGFGDVFYRVPLEDSDDFFIEHRYPTGQRRTVAKQMKFFLNQGAETLPQSRLPVKFPYDQSRLSRPFSEEYFTLFPRGSGRARVVRAEDFPEVEGIRKQKTKRSKTDRSPSHQVLETNGPTQQDEAQDKSDWSELDYLLDKYPAAESDDGLPVYGDSGDEGDFDDNTWREIREEEEERNREPAHMTPPEVDTTIDAIIEELKQEWRGTKFAKVQMKAYRLWVKAAKKKRRQEELEYYKYWSDRCLKNTNKIKRALADDVWRNPMELRKQCQNIELAVFQHEEFKYYHQVLLRDSPPNLPPPTALKATQVQRQPVLEEGEELIESESESLGDDDDDDDDDDDFLDDSSNAGSIHHDPDLEDWNPVIPEKDFPPTIATDQIPPSTHEPISEPQASSESIDMPADDADVDSDDEIVTPTSRRWRQIKAEVTPSMAKKAAPKISPKTPTAKHVLQLPPAPELAGRDSGSDTSDLDRFPHLPKTKYRKHGRTKLAPVDLTLSNSPSSVEQSANDTSTSFKSVRTPELNPTHPQTPPKRKFRRRNLLSQDSRTSSDRRLSRDGSRLPDLDDIQGILDTEWSEIEDDLDKRRALAKAIYGLEQDTVNNLNLLLSSLPSVNQVEDILFKGLLGLSADDHIIEDVKPKDQAVAQLLTFLYMTYICCQNMVDCSSLSEGHRNTAFGDLEHVVDSFYEDLHNLIGVFIQGHKDSRSIQSIKKRKRNQESALEGLEDSDAQMTDYPPTEELDPDIPPPSHKKRKRKVEESQQAISLQQSDQQRIQEQERRRQKMAEKFAQFKADGNAVEPINTTEPYVHLHPHIAQRVKPHQLNGIQFMWREIIEDPKHQGCILAHTMGLGKTMQVISLLVTISLCNQSDDPDIRKQIPAYLRESKTLILCPASLVENWFDELLMWTPHQAVLGHIHKFDSPDKSIIRDWSKNGGILLISYDRFRRSISDSVKAKAKGDVSIDTEKILLDEPNLAIADEAHILKNPRSSINQYAKRLKTTSRIALTGSPLNNHLEEYHTMIDWIAPGYLGDIVQFRSKYSEPINEGLYSDSTPYEKRLCLRKLHVLKRDLDPKINRADISAVEKDMPTKTEYFITIPLTDLQKKAYDIYVNYMHQSYGDTKARSRNARIWTWIAMLSWLCHHPSCFLAKLRERSEQNGVDNQLMSGDEDGTEANRSNDEAPTPDTIAADVQIDTIGPMSEAMRQVTKLFKNWDTPESLNDPSLSYRTLAVQYIVEQATRVGDKTLIFTHSIPTLDYLEGMLRRMKCAFCRLDGKTKVADRQAYTKEFNKKQNYQVFLISMRAGGLGLNLQGANRVIIFDFSFNPSWEQQAIGRAYRLNQKTPVFVYRFQAGGTFEDVLFNRAVFKTHLFGRVVDKKRPERHASKKVTEYLFPARDVEQQDFTDCLGKDPRVLDAIIGRLSCVRSIVLTETFQKEDDEQLNDEEQKAAEEEFRDQRLQREDPAAWQAKQAARLSEARKQQQPTFTQQPVFSATTTSAPMSVFSHTATGTSHSFRYSIVQPPFSRENLNRPLAPRPPQALQAPQTGLGFPVAYDDTFQGFVPQPASTRRATSLDPDPQMS